MTASPAKLHLLLIDGAIRNLQRALHEWRLGNNEPACESICKTQDILGELLAGLNQETVPELAGKISAVYSFLLRSVGEALQSRDEHQLQKVIEVLGIERETWKQVAEMTTTVRGVVATSLEMPTSGLTLQA